MAGRVASRLGGRSSEVRVPEEPANIPGSAKQEQARAGAELLFGTVPQPISAHDAFIDFPESGNSQLYRALRYSIYRGEESFMFDIRQIFPRCKAPFAPGKPLLIKNTILFKCILNANVERNRETSEDATFCSGVCIDTRIPAGVRATGRYHPHPAGATEVCSGSSILFTV